MVEVTWIAIDVWEHSYNDRMYIQLDGTTVGGGTAKLAENQGTGTVCGWKYGEFGPFLTIGYLAHSANSLTVNIIAHHLKLPYTNLLEWMQ